MQNFTTIVEVFFISFTGKVYGPIVNDLSNPRFIYHNIVKDVQKFRKHPLISLLFKMLHAVLFTRAFMFMFQLIGLRNAHLCWEFLPYNISGVFSLRSYIYSAGVVFGADGPTLSKV